MAVTWTGDDFIKNITTRLTDGSKKAGEYLRNKIQDKIPNAELTVEQVGLTSSVINDSPEALSVELGTRKTPPQPIMRQTLVEEFDAIVKIVTGGN